MGPNPIMCEGYERGLGFLPGVGIDQHFTQRKRLPDMTALMKTYPQLLGVGLDEATAIVVKGHVAEVMGRGKAHFYDRRKPVEEGKPDYETVAADGRYDLQARVVQPSGERVAAHVGIFLNVMPARNIGPANMGGRIVDISVAESNPKIIFVAAATGGVWKSVNSGDTWVPVFEREGTASIGAVAAAPSNPNVIYVGTGEGNPRNSVSSGDGVYKSIDGGRSWEHVGLTETRQIDRIVVHPKNPDVVYVAAIGHFWGPNPERGLYKSSDGGRTWQKSKYIDENTGFVDVTMDPTDPQTLYASTYHVRRDGFSGGNPAVQTGPDTGLYKTTDGGKNWAKMTTGLPDRPLGRCGLAISRKNPNVVFAVVQTDKTAVTTAGQAPKPGDIVETGGVFRSVDKGATWKKLNDLCPRPFYYGQIRIDPNDDQRVYVLGVGFFVSTDGGKSFASTRTGAHPDHHALWIDPKDSNHLILGNDGGLYVSKDRAKTFEPVRAMAIGQFYGVAADMRTPYRVYGGLQDNGSWGGPSATQSSEGITLADWKRVAGADGFQCAVDPTDPTIVYAEGQYGRLQRISLRGDRPLSKAIQPRAERGAPAYRFNWNSPLLLSPHDPKTVYFGGNFLFKSTDRGDRWEAISPDLTRGKPGASTNFDHTLTAIAESPVMAGILWAGSDDGRLHVTRDGGKTWTDLSKNIPNVPQARTIARIECSHFDAGTAFVAIDRHRNDDLRPYLFKTTDFGATWVPIANNLPSDEAVNVIRESSKNKNLLFAGTDVGLYVSLDGGAEWYHYRGLPTVPVHDLLIHPRDRDLIIGTHGRSIYVMDVAPLEELTEKIRKSSVHMFAVKPATLFEYRKSETPVPAGQYKGANPPFGAAVSYYLRSAPASPVTLTVQDASGTTIATLSGAREAGYHRAIWNLRASNKLVEPGEYEVTLTVDGKTVGRPVNVVK